MLWKSVQTETALSNVVALALILPLILYLGYSGVMAGHMADVKGTVETAASVAARDYANGGTVAHAQMVAYEVVTGSLSTGGTIQPTNPSNNGALSGVLSYSGGDYYITSMSGVITKVKPGDGTVSGQLSSLVGQDVTASGNYVTVPQMITLSYITSDPVPTQTVNEAPGQNDTYNNTQTVDQSAAGGVEATPWQTLAQTQGSGGNGGSYSGSQAVSQTTGQWQPGQTLTAGQVDGVSNQWGQGPWGTSWGNSYMSGYYWLWSHPGGATSISYGEQANFAGGFYGPQAWSQYTLYTDGDDSSTSWYSFTDSAGVHSGSASSGGATPGSVSFNVQDSAPGILQVSGTAQNSYGPAGYISALVYDGPYYTTAYTVPANMIQYGYYNHYPAFSVPTSQYVSISDPNNAGSPASMWLDDWTTQQSVANNEGGGGTGGGGNPFTYYAVAGHQYSVDIWGSSHNYNLQILLSNPQGVFGTDGNWSVTDTTGVNYQPVTLPTAMAPGATYPATVTVTNSDQSSYGIFTWPDDDPSNWNNTSQWADPVHVSYHWFQNGQELSTGNKVALPHNVGPGTSATINLPIIAPSTPGTYQLQIDTVEEPNMWFSGMKTNTVNATITVGNTGPEWNASYSPVSFPTNVAASSTTNNIQVTVQNTGSQTWEPNKTWMAYYPQGQPGYGFGAVTVNQNVPPGRSYTFTLPFTAPSSLGQYNFTIDMAETQGGWWNNGFWFSSQGANYVNGSVMVLGTDGYSASPITAPVNVAPGSTATIPITVTNLGTHIWGQKISLRDGWYSGSTWVKGSDSVLYVSGQVGQGQSYTFNYQISAPATPGQYTVLFDLHDDWDVTIAGNEYTGWFGGKPKAGGGTIQDMSIPINVETTYGVHYSPVAAPTVMGAGSTAAIQVTAENTGDFTWPAGGNNPVHISYHWLQNGNVVINDGNRATLPGDLAPGQNVTVNLSVTAPSSLGSYTLQIDTVQEGVTWFCLNQNASTVNIPVTVPSGQEMTGQLTEDGQGNYWIGTTEVVPNGQSVSQYLNQNVSAWGTVTPGDSYFLATDVEPAQDYNNGLSAGTQYDPNLDCAVYTETVNGIQYAVAQVRYHYPVPIPTLPMLLNTGASPLNNSEAVYGTAAYAMGT